MKVRVLIDMDDGASGIRAVNVLDSAMREYNEKLRRADPSAEVDFEVLGIDRARAGVVADEPEWDYGVGYRWNGTVYAFSTGTRDAAEEYIGRHPDDPDFGPHLLVRREPERSAGLWGPVKQEGADGG